MTIDAHQHFWQFDPVRDAWINEEMQILQRDFMPAELADLYQELGIDGCIAVQADQSEAETQFLVDLANQHDFIKGVVGWVDLRSPDIEARLVHFAQEPRIKGFRHIVQGESDPNFILRPDFTRGIAHLASYDFTYDILVFPHQLGAVLEFVRRFPGQKFVIDHLAKPYIKDQYYDGWANQMRAIAQSPNVFCKVSGMVTEADWQNWRYEDFIPYLDLVFEAFGFDRLMFGSDWPVCLLGGDYTSVKGTLDQYLKASTPEEQAKFWGQNANSFYHLGMI